MTDRPDEPDETGPDPIADVVERMLADFRVPTETQPADPGSLDWIRKTLRTGGADEDPLVGSLFQGKYRILRRIGRGGFGAVYEAVDERGAKNRVALKLQLPGLTGSQGNTETFRNEAIRVTRLNHPNIVDWKSFDETPDGGSYFVMELLDGVELNQELERVGCMGWERVLKLMLQILAALRAAHFLGKGQSILHLDLKPKNILLLPATETRPEHIKVIDFGIGQFLGSDAVEKKRESATDTIAPPVPAAVPAKKGTMATVQTEGSESFARRSAKYKFEISRAYTAEYASPEQCMHIEFATGASCDPVALDGRADIYSLGIIAYELLTGRLPFKPPTHRFFWLRVHQDTPTEPWGEHESKVPADLRRFVERCLEKRREDRFTDSREALEVLERIASPPRTKRIVAAALCLVMVGVAIAMYLQPSYGRLVLTGESGELTHQYMGPDSPPWVVQLSMETGALPGSIANSLRLRAVDGNELDHWTIARGTDPDQFLLSPPAGPRYALPGGRVDTRAIVASRDGAWESYPFNLVWLGPETAQSQVRLGSQVIETTQEPLAVDPEGLVLQLHFPQLRGEDLNHEEWGVWPEPPGKFRLTGNGDSLGAFLEIQLGPMPADTAHLQVRGQDRSGRNFELQYPVVMHAAPLGVQFDLQTLRPAATSPWPPHQPKTFFSHEQSGLSLRTLRPALVHCEQLGFEGQTQWHDGQYIAQFDLARWLPEQPRRQDLELTFTVQDQVLHNRALHGLRHSQVFDLPLRIIEARDVVWSLHAKAPPSAFASMQSHQSVCAGMDQPIYVEADRPLPGHSYETVLHIQGKSHLVPALENEDTRFNLLPYLPRAAEGLVQGHIPFQLATFLLDSSGKRLTPTALSTQELDLLVDSTYPQLQEPSASPGTLRNFDQPWEIEFAYPPEPGSDVVLKWSFRALSDRDYLGLDFVFPQTRPDGRKVFSVRPLEGLSNPDRLRDGEYTIQVDAIDRAGNQGPVKLYPVELARRGPKITVLVPDQVGWGPIPWVSAGSELQTIELKVDDPNGVASARCWVYRSDTGEMTVGTQRLPADAIPRSDQDPGNRWFWKFAPPPSWSRAADVWLWLEADDKFGNPSEPIRHGPLALPALAEHHEPYLDGMFLVPGNPEASYIFKGRTSVLRENRCFSDAGLAAIWVAPDLEKPGESEGAWGLELPSESIRPFYLGEREVSNAEMLAFLYDLTTGYMQAAHWETDVEPGESRRKHLIQACKLADPEEPVTDIWQAEANAYARSKGKRLPTLLELTYTIRGGAAHYRAVSWDVQPGAAQDRSNPWQRVRGLSLGAEWTASPVKVDQNTRLALKPRDPSHFLAETQHPALSGQSFWISGTPGSHFSHGDHDLRTDFAAVDMGDAVNWSDQRVGFRLAWNADRALEATRASHSAASGQGQDR